MSLGGRLKPTQITYVQYVWRKMLCFYSVLLAGSICGELVNRTKDMCERFTLRLIPLPRTANRIRRRRKSDKQSASFSL